MKKISVNQIRTQETYIQHKTSFDKGIGSAYSNGQNIRSLFDLNNNGPYILNPTNDDIQDIINTYPEIFQAYPNLTDYTYLYTVTNPEVLQTKDNPLFKLNGRSFGEITVYDSGTQNTGDEQYFEPQYKSFYYSNVFNGVIDVPERQTLPTLKYPFSGIIYSGSLLQLQVEDGNVKVIPYQAGHGIPQYDPTKPNFSGNAFGIPLYPSSGLEIQPVLSMGAVPGNNDACLGVSVSTKGDSVYKYLNRNNWPWEQTDQHPAPFTAESTLFRGSDRSPENSGGHFYAPWSEYYSYQDEPIPVCSKGLVSVPIGAATNIGAMAYYEPDVAEGDNPINNPNYVSVSIVPLFQGERVSVGNYAYATAMGNVITPLPEGTFYGPVPSFSDASGLREHDVRGGDPQDPDDIYLQGNIQRDGRRDNPYYDYFDPTYGACGWTSTPQFRFQNIPDQGVQIIETRNGVSLPYLNQSTQGQCIVQATTFDNTSGRKELVGPCTYTTENDKQRRLNKLPGNPGRCLSIGKTMETIEGTGQWTYTGSLIDLDQSEFLNGVFYEDGIYNTRGGTGNGLTVDIVTDFNGSVVTVDINSLGSGYTNGDILTIVNTINWARGTYDFIQRCATVVYNNGSISLSNQGSNYTSSVYVPTFNLSANNMLIEATCTNNVTFPDSSNNNSLFSYITSATVNNVFDTSRYVVGTQIALITEDANPDNWAVVQVTSNDGTTIALSLTNRRGGRNVYQLGTYIYATQIVGFEHPSVNISATDGEVTDIKMLDIPFKNRDGDFILIRQGDNNCIFQMDIDISRINQFSQKLVKGGVGYRYNPELLVDVFIPGVVNTTRNEIYVEGTTFFSGEPTYSGFITNVDSFGSIKSLWFRFNEGFVQLDGSTYEPAFMPNSYGDIQTLIRIDESISPFNRVNSEVTATFVQGVRFFIQNPGSGYSIGSFDVSGGSGTGMEIFITKVTDTGGIVELLLKEYGSNYKYNDIVSIVGGNNDSLIKFKLPSKQEFVLYNGSIIAGNDRIVPVPGYDVSIINPGSGYDENTLYNLDVEEGYGINSGTFSGLRLIVEEVGPDGEILDCQVDLLLDVQLLDRIPQGNQYGYRMKVVGGVDGMVEIRRPIKTERVEITSGGSGYTTSSNVSTFNYMQNTLRLFCTNGGVSGQCIASGVFQTGRDVPLLDLSRYRVGDILALLGTGSNISATIEITSISVDELTVTQITNGSGYGFLPAIGAFIRTINLSRIPTTVDIVAENGEIQSATINTLGEDVRYNDMLVIDGGDNNAVYQVSTEKDVPAPWQQFENGRSATADEWNNYKNVLKTSVNLLDQQILVDFQKTHPNYYDQSWNFYGDPDNKDPFDAGQQTA